MNVLFISPGYPAEMADFSRGLAQCGARVVGLDELRRRYGPHIVVEDLLPLGAPRRNWKQTLISDGYLIVRHPELDKTLEIADGVGRVLQLDAR